MERAGSRRQTNVSRAFPVDGHDFPLTQSALFSSCSFQALAKGQELDDAALKEVFVGAAGSDDDLRLAECLYRSIAHVKLGVDPLNNGVVLTLLWLLHYRKLVGSRGYLYVKAAITFYEETLERVREGTAKLWELRYQESRQQALFPNLLALLCGLFGNSGEGAVSLQSPQTSPLPACLAPAVRIMTRSLSLYDTERWQSIEEVGDELSIGNQGEGHENPDEMDIIGSSHTETASTWANSGRLGSCANMDELRDPWNSTSERRGGLFAAAVVTAARLVSTGASFSSSTSGVLDRSPANFEPSQMTSICHKDGYARNSFRIVMRSSDKDSTSDTLQQ